MYRCETKNGRKYYTCDGKRIAKNKIPKDADIQYDEQESKDFFKKRDERSSEEIKSNLLKELNELKENGTPSMTTHIFQNVINLCDIPEELIFKSISENVKNYLVTKNFILKLSFSEEEYRCFSKELFEIVSNQDDLEKLISRTKTSKDYYHKIFKKLLENIQEEDRLKVLKFILEQLNMSYIQLNKLFRSYSLQFDKLQFLINVVNSDINIERIEAIFRREMENREQNKHEEQWRQYQEKSKKQQEDWKKKCEEEVNRKKEERKKKNEENAKRSEEARRKQEEWWKNFFGPNFNQSNPMNKTNILHEQKIYTKRDWKQWLLKNHPDKNKNIDPELVARVNVEASKLFR
jgi:hypothetical protein